MSARGGFALRRIEIFRPLRVRDFALLWSGMTVSALGDGIYTVALAWQVYNLSNTPTALSFVGVAWFLPQIAAVLVGGVVADRVDRRRVMIFADVVRAGAIGAMGALSIAGGLHLWHIWVLVAVYGIGNSVFYPAYTALVPQVLPEEMLVQAAALRQLVRPLSTRVAGPALGGALVAALGPGTGFLIDAGSFAASTAALLVMTARPLHQAAGATVTTVLRDIRRGISYTLSQRWLALTLLAVTLTMVFFLGPVFVLMPFVVRNHLHGGAGGLGLVLAAGGVGAVAASLVTGQRGSPRRPLTVIYLAWTIAVVALVGYAEADAVWQAALVSVGSVGALVAGQILWESLLQRSIPGQLLGRVASVDSFVSSGLVPVSLAITGPVAEALGARTTLRWAGVFAAAILLFFFAVVVVAGLAAIAPGPAPDPGRTSDSAA